MMRSTSMCLLLVVSSAMAGGNGRFSNVTATYPDLAVSFFHQPLSGEGTGLPFLQASVALPSMEDFGLYFDVVSPGFRWLEVLDGKGRTIESLSVNDAIGGTVPRRVRLLPGGGSERPRRAEIRYTVKAHGQDLEVVTKAVAIGEDDGAEQLLVVTFALRSQKEMPAGLRVKLPAVGDVFEGPQGFFVVSKSGRAAIVSTILPRATRMQVEKNIITIVAAPQRLPAGREVSLFWCVIRGIGPSDGSSTQQIRKQALHALSHDRLQSRGPNILVLNVETGMRGGQPDTISYLLVCLNAGIDPAAGIVVRSPVPQGAQYLEGSASSELQLLAQNREERPGRSLIEWNLTHTLQPGEEHLSGFRVVVSEVGLGRNEQNVGSEARHPYR